MASPAHTPTIVVLGSIIMDLTGIAPRLPSQGDVVVGERFYTAPGGKGANQAVAAARMGARVRMVGRVGSDEFGPRLLDTMQAHGIDVSGVAVDPGHASGVAIILLDAQRQNHIVAIYGANMECDDDQLRAVESALEGADLLLLQIEVPFHVSLAAARLARKRGVRVIWDPAPAVSFPASACSEPDVLTPNQAEAAVLTGIEVTDVASARTAAEALVELGARGVVVKLGELGVYYASNGEGGYVPSYEVDVVDTVAAGDAFGGALAVALGEGKSLREAVSITGRPPGRSP